jgi:serine phosphatase RsbU (regulator of sigma subunit)
MGLKAIIRLLFIASAVLWLALLFTDISVLLSTRNSIPADIPSWLPRILLNLFILTLFFYYKLKVERDELNFVDLLWKVFATGLIATVISLLFRLFVYLMGNTRLAGHVVFYDFIYLVNLGLTVSFLLMAFTAWKRLILYHKSKWLLRLWTFFEYGLLASLAYNSLNLPLADGIFVALMIIFLIVGLVLSANMKWVAFLNFKQKWTSLLLLLLTIFYLMYGFYTNGSYAESSQSLADHRAHIFVISLMSFVTIYGVFSFLVILFNLPTTSAFEQKFEEVTNFQRISQSIQTEQSEESVYNILLDTSVRSASADAAWLEVHNPNKEARIFTYHISEREAHDIITHLKDHQVRGVLDQSTDKTKNLSRHLSKMRTTRFRSIIAFPIVVKNESIGTIALLKELPEGFNKDMTRIVGAFANQAAISIENFRLMEEAFQTERYKEELKIAKTVQKSLLPTLLEKGDFEIVAFSESADEVGGDYYDTLRISEEEVSLIIADVSGKGTTAAFHMSQMKGIFHSLAQDCIQPDVFMTRANQALIRCLERGSFISASFFLINNQTRRIRYARAGHCPVLYYKAATGCASFLEDKGIALGMVRNDSFRKYIQNNELEYSVGDVLVLYTDGITEAKNNRGDEFGMDRLANAVQEAKDLSPEEIQRFVIERLYEFSGSDLDDDYTMMIVKFR